MGFFPLIRLIFKRLWKSAIAILSSLMCVVLSVVVGTKERPLLRREIWSFVNTILLRLRTFLGKLSGQVEVACGRDREERVWSTLKKETG